MKKISIPLLLIAIGIAACSKKTTSIAANKDAAINGNTVFGNNCSRCHGPTGTEGRSPNLSKSTLAKDKLVETITNGHDHMPSFKDKLSDKEITAVADWILSIRK